METYEPILALIAEISATFVGFSLAIGLLGSDAPGSVVRMTSMRAVAELALIGGGGALFALLLPTFGWIESAVWRASSFTTLVLWISFHTFAARRLRQGGNPFLRVSVIRTAFGLVVVAMLLLFSNCLMPNRFSGPIYCVALAIALATSAYLFVQATFVMNDE